MLTAARLAVKMATAIVKVAIGSVQRRHHQLPSPRLTVGTGAAATG